jgi:hypothetical protein
MFAGPGRSRRVRGRAPRTAPARRSWDAGTRPLVRSYARAMTLVLLSGRPGAGKTAFSSWLAAQRGFVHVETDAEWSKWGPLVCVQSPEAAVATRNLARALGPNVVIEWGFKVAHLGCVRQLRAAGFDAWWLDGEEAAARQSYISRQGDSAGVMAAYRVRSRRSGKRGRDWSASTATKSFAPSLLVLPTCPLTKLPPSCSPMSAPDRLLRCRLGGQRWLRAGRCRFGQFVVRPGGPLLPAPPLLAPGTGRRPPGLVLIAGTLVCAVARGGR